MTITFEVFGTPQPQGSSRAFVIGGKARITSANPKMKSFRQEVTREALAQGNSFAKHVPIRCTCLFTFRRPPSIPKKRTEHVVKPDTDKLLRCIGDALTGSVWHDDSQVVEMSGRKRYGAVEGVQITVEEL